MIQYAYNSPNHDLGCAGSHPAARQPPPGYLFRRLPDFFNSPTVPSFQKRSLRKVQMPVNIMNCLITLGDKLLSIVPSFLKAKIEQRDRLADYCEQISLCLSRAYVDLDRGQIPHGCCSEMDHYMRDLKDVLGKILSPKEHEELHDALSVAYEVEHLDRELRDCDRPGSKYAELAIASGKFSAVANKIRAT
jgi:hypothetical protein